jgi:hypothetical protein
MMVLSNNADQGACAQVPEVQTADRSSSKSSHLLAQAALVLHKRWLAVEH